MGVTTHTDTGVHTSSDAASTGRDTGVSYPDTWTSNPDAVIPGVDSSIPGTDATKPVDANPPVDSSKPEKDSGHDVAPPPPGDAGAGVTAVHLYACAENVYSAPVTIEGDQTFELLVDTGSGALAVASSSCAECIDGGAGAGYTPGSSATALGATSCIYGSGSWKGEAYQDTVSMGGSPTAEVKLAAINTEKGFFGIPDECDFNSTDTGIFAGIIGFGPSGTGAAVPHTNVFFDDLVATGVANIFTTQLCDTGGTLWLGGYDSTAFKAGATPQYIPMLTGALAPFYYVVHLESVEVDGTTVTVPTGSYTSSVLDTGTSMLLIQATAFDAMATAIEADPAFKAVVTGGAADAGSVTFFSRQDCMNATFQPACMAPSSTLTKAYLDANLPPVTFTLGTGPTVTLQAPATESYLMNLDGQWCQAACGATPSMLTFPMAGIIGSEVLKSTIVIFDRANKQFGFVPWETCQ